MAMKFVNMLNMFKPKNTHVLHHISQKGGILQQHILPRKVNQGRRDRGNASKLKVAQELQAMVLWTNLSVIPRQLQLWFLREINDFPKANNICYTCLQTCKKDLGWHLTFDNWCNVPKPKDIQKHEQLDCQVIIHLDAQFSFLNSIKNYSHTRQRHQSAVSSEKKEWQVFIFINASLS